MKYHGQAGDYQLTACPGFIYIAFQSMHTAKKYP
jgi:hypothetical protein